MGDTRLEPLVLSEAERRTLENLAKRRKTAQGAGAAGADRAGLRGRRAQYRCGRAAGRQPDHRQEVTDRFLARRLDGLGDEPRAGVPRTISDAQVEGVVVRALEEVPGAPPTGPSGNWPARWHLPDQRTPDLAGVRAAALAH